MTNRSSGNFCADREVRIGELGFLFAIDEGTDAAGLDPGRSGLGEEIAENPVVQPARRRERHPHQARIGDADREHRAFARRIGDAHHISGRAIDHIVGESFQHIARRQGEADHAEPHRRPPERGIGAFAGRAVDAIGFLAVERDLHRRLAVLVRAHSYLAVGDAPARMILGLDPVKIVRLVFDRHRPAFIVEIDPVEMIAAGVAIQVAARRRIGALDDGLRGERGIGRRDLGSKGRGEHYARRHRQCRGAPAHHLYATVRPKLRRRGAVTGKSRIVVAALTVGGRNSVRTTVCALSIERSVSTAVRSLSKLVMNAVTVSALFNSTPKRRLSVLLSPAQPRLSIWVKRLDS